ncbi:MAG: formate dehydrogenase accessory sulfurtransferase FdhD [Methanomassiliicoccales archaeon]|nr:MAG: formate dehydrogenase accessory sulfurtransferase FdhD [Methanomassiliicoccales archaeon]
MKQMKILRWQDGDLTELSDKIAEGCFLHLELNDGVGFDTMISPDQVKEFVYGNLFSEGFIKKSKDVLSYHHKRKGNNISAKVRLAEEKKISFARNYNVIWTDCASPSLIQKRMGDKLTKVKSTLKLDPQSIIKASKKTRELSQPYKETGALHSAFLFDGKMNLITHAHDVSRHNAVDKVIGIHFLDGKSFKNTVIMTTGRITSSMVLKCLRARIPMVVSRGAPLYDSIELAREYGLGVIGFLRGRRFNIYSGEEMLTVGDVSG